jgi:hypothetical protein
VDFENQQADAVLCMGTLGVFVPMEVSWLKGLHRWLGPGGVFCFDVVAWQPQEERKRSWKQAFALGCRVFAPGWAKTAIDHRFEATHIHLTETQLRARLFSAGFEIQKLQAWESPTVKRIDLIGWAKK